MSRLGFEVERKFWVARPDEVVRRLGEVGLELSEAVQQVDRYFAHPARDFQKTDEALRLRTVGTRTSLTYKGARIDSTTKTRRELEVPLPDSAKSAVDAEALLDVLDFRRIMVIRKFRQTGHFRWEDYDIRVCLDEIDPLGFFVELETGSDLENLDVAKDALASLARRLGLDRSERRSYLELMLEQIGPSQVTG